MKCRYCGCEFIPKSQRQHECSEKCRRRYANAMHYKKIGRTIHNKICLACGRSFISLQEDTRFCFDCKQEKAKREKEERELMKDLSKKNGDHAIKKINHMARVAGETYGQFVARTETTPFVRASMARR